VPDAVGWRVKLGVVIPSTNTVVEPEFASMQPRGVTNHTSRINIPNLPLESNDDFSELIRLIQVAQREAIERLLSCEPDRLVLGISAETFWDGLEASTQLKRDLEQLAGRPVSLGAEACASALSVYDVRRLGIITPYWPVGDTNVRRFFEQSGFDVVALEGLRCASPVLIAHVSEAELRRALRIVDVREADAIVQVGTNLSMARLAGEAERWLGKPVIAINTAIYWHALRNSGVMDPIAGFGSLLLEH
jgi:maleate isomerase